MPALLVDFAVYLGAIEAAFSALMRLSLRLVAERSGRPDALGAYLDDPLLLACSHVISSAEAAQ